jgi:serine/threonine protein kinase
VPEAVTRADLGALELREQLGSGGQGSVIQIETPTSHRCPVVLKLYTPQVVNQLDASILEDMTRFPLSLESSDMEWLYENLAWPLMVAESNGVACGFIMCKADPSYYFPFQTQTRGTRSVLADMAFLLNSDNYVSRAGLSISERDRLELLVNLAEILSRMHAMGIVLGDFSPKNILFKLQPSPSCFIIDCDTAVFQGATALRQVETPDWEVPNKEPLGTKASDLYKFGLLAIRLFARDQVSTDVSALDDVSSSLKRLAEKSLERNPADRPSPEAWIDILNAAIRHASSAPATFTGSAPAPDSPEPTYDISGEPDIFWLRQHALGPARAVRSSARSPVISLS